MGSTRCRHFVQNAWKKDLCSNCFKSKDEHAAATPVRLPAQLSRPTNGQSAPPPQGILKGADGGTVGSWSRGSRAKKKAHKVYFPAEESEVIGEGGEDAGPPSDDDDDYAGSHDDWSSPLAEDDPQEREEERLLQALTRSNTDFNSVASNLEVSAANGTVVANNAKNKQASREPLQLGRPLTDAEGRKQTLLVSVQPFGGKDAVKEPGKDAVKDVIVNKDHVTKIPVATPPVNGTSCNGGVVLKSIVQHTSDDDVDLPAKPSAKPVPCESTAPQSAPSALGVELNKKKDVVITTSPASKTTSVLSPSSKTTSAPTVKTSCTASPIPYTATSKAISAPTPYTSSTKTVSTPTPFITSSKTAALTSTPTTTTTTSLKLNDAQGPAAGISPHGALSSKHMFLKSIVEPAAADVYPITLTASDPVATTATTPLTSKTTTSMTNSGTATSRREGKRTHITRGTPISKNNELLLKTKFNPLRTSAILNNNNNNNNKRNADKDSVILIDSKLIDSSDEEDHRAYSNVQVSSPGKHGAKRLDVVKDVIVKEVVIKDMAAQDAAKEVEESAQTKRLSSLLAPLGPLGSTTMSSTVAVGVGSRELAGEPDGRADPDSSSESGSEPPALPQSPPPAVDPRPSFLHGLTARLASDKFVEKPRVPFKSSTVVQAASVNSSVQRWATVVENKIVSEPPQAPSCSPPSTPPQGQLAGESGSRAHKRQAPQPPQETSGPPSPSGSSSGSTPPSTPVKEPHAHAPHHRPALGRSASIEAPPSPSSGPAYQQRVHAGHASKQAAKQDAKRRSVASPTSSSSSPAPSLAVSSRSESVPSGLAVLGLAGLGQSVTLGAHSGHSIAQALAQANSFVSMSPSASSAQHPGPQPSPRRALSLSTDSLSSGSPGSPPSPSKHVMSYDTERKKMGTKVRFSLRKFLGLSKDMMAVEMLAESGAPQQPPQPRPRPRLEIIHPSDLSGTAVEVLRGSGSEVRRQMQEAAEAAARRNSDTVLASPLASPLPGQDHGDAAKARPTKPPPPPRSQSLESDGPASSTASCRPSRPPPPKSADLLMRRASSSSSTSPTTSPSTQQQAGGHSVHSVYANIAVVAGEVRPNVAPLKPQRTGSVRDAGADGPRRTPLNQDATPAKDKQDGKEPPVMPVRTCSLPAAAPCAPCSQPEDSGYESVELSDSTQPQSMTDSDNVYECVNGTGERSSSPECDSKRSGPGSAAAVDQRLQHGVVGDRGDYQKMSTFGRPYCGSETESDIYSPYSFYGSEEGEEGEAESSWKWRSRGRKGRSVVHKSMEDNYGAVVGANLEALAQLLEQIRTGPAVPTSLRPLKTVSSLSWGDFTLEQPDKAIEQVAVTAGRWVFLPALWDRHAVTLAVLPEGVAGVARGRVPLPFALMPITEFSDLVPSTCLPSGKRPPNSHVQASVSVLARVRVDTLSSYGAWLGHASSSPTMSSTVADAELAWRDAGLALLQLVNALRALQGQGVDEVDPDGVVFLRDPHAGLGDHGDGHGDGTAQLAVLHAEAQGPAHGVSPCQCVLLGVQALLPNAPPAALLKSLLRGQESASLSLDRAKAVLEFWLWGPALSVAKEAQMEDADGEAALQRWLDLERATVLHRLVCARAAAGPSHRLAIGQQGHLLFLVHTCAKTMHDASKLLRTESVMPLENTL